MAQRRGSGARDSSKMRGKMAAGWWGRPGLFVQEQPAPISVLRRHCDLSHDEAGALRYGTSRR